MKSKMTVELLDRKEGLEHKTITSFLPSKGSLKVRLEVKGYPADGYLNNLKVVERDFSGTVYRAGSQKLVVIGSIKISNVELLLEKFILISYVKVKLTGSGSRNGGSKKKKKNVEWYYVTCLECGEYYDWNEAGGKCIACESSRIIE